MKDKYNNIYYLFVKDNLFLELKTNIIIYKYTIKKIKTKIYYGRSKAMFKFLDFLKLKFSHIYYDWTNKEPIPTHNYPNTILKSTITRSSAGASSKASLEVIATAWDACSNSSSIVCSQGNFSSHHFMESMKPPSPIATEPVLFFKKIEINVQSGKTLEKTSDEI